MAEQNPFERMFSPSSGTPFDNMMSSVGRMMGVEQRNEAFGRLQSEALAEFGRLQQEEGLPANQAFTKLMMSPQGKELFQYEGGLEAIRGVIASQVQGRPQPTTIGPGQKAVTYSEHGKVIPGSEVSNPTMEQQNALFWKEASGVSRERWKQIAEYQLMGDTAQKLAIFKELELNGEIPKGSAIGLATGNIDVKALKATDRWNNLYDTGQIAITDKAQRTTVITGGSGPAQGSSVTPPAPVTPEDPLGVAPEAEKLKTFTSIGPWSTSLRYLDNIIRGTIDVRAGTPEGHLATMGEKNRLELRSAVTSLPEVVGRSNMVIKSFTDLLPTQWHNQLDAIEAGIQLRQMIDREIVKTEGELNENPRTGMVSPETKSKLSKWRLGLIRVQQLLPSLEALQIAKEATLRDGGGAMGAVEGGKALWNLGTRGVNAAVGAATGTSPKSDPGGATGEIPPQEVPLPRLRPQAQDRTAEIANMAEAELRKLMQSAIPLTPAERAAGQRRVLELRQERKRRISD